MLDVAAVWVDARAALECVLAPPTRSSPRTRLIAKASRLTVVCHVCARSPAAFFLGGAPRLKHKEVISSSADRFRLQTEPAGDLHLRLSVLPKDMAKYGVLM